MVFVIILCIPFRRAGVLSTIFCRCFLSCSKKIVFIHKIQGIHTHHIRSTFLCTLVLITSIHVCMLLSFATLTCIHVQSMGRVLFFFISSVVHGLQPRGRPGGISLPIAMALKNFFALQYHSWGTFRRKWKHGWGRLHAFARTNLRCEDKIVLVFKTVP